MKIGIDRPQDPISISNTASYALVPRDDFGTPLPLDVQLGPVSAGQVIEVGFFGCFKTPTWVAQTWDWEVLFAAVVTFIGSPTFPDDYQLVQHATQRIVISDSLIQLTGNEWRVSLTCKAAFAVPTDASSCRVRLAHIWNDLGSSDNLTISTTGVLADGLGLNLMARRYEPSEVAQVTGGLVSL